jgi:hypothetical protein
LQRAEVTFWGGNIWGFAALRLIIMKNNHCIWLWNYVY